MSVTMHENEIIITGQLVKELVNEQFPQWQNLPLKRINSMGTDNVIYRLGEHMCIRLPKREQKSKPLNNELILKLSRSLPIKIPVVLAQGAASVMFPYSWVVVSWIDGEDLSQSSNIDLNQIAINLADFILALQKQDTKGGTIARRGRPLITQDVDVRKAIASLSTVINIEAITQLWEQCLHAPAWHKPPVWIHGDLLPANIIVKHGKVSGILDFDSMGIGDPAVDLLPAWSILSKDSREIFRAKLEVDDATWIRGRGWALSIALIIIPYYIHTNPGLTKIAYHMLDELMDDE